MTPGTEAGSTPDSYGAMTARLFALSARRLRRCDQARGSSGFGAGGRTHS